MTPKRSPKSLAAQKAEPRSAKEFAKLWSVPEGVNVLEGNDVIPDVTERQNRLVGHVLNLCIITHIYEGIKKRQSYDSLKSLFKDLGDRDAAMLEKMFDYSSAHAPSEDEKLAMLLKLSKEKKILSQRDLVPSEVWEKFVSDSNDFTSHRSQKAPTDPRILACNDKIGATIRMFGEGAKLPKSIARKMYHRNCELSQLRDINRIGILPTIPQYAEDFVRIMEALYPPKVIEATAQGNKTIPQFFAEEPEIFENGYFNQKLCVALDRMARSRHKSTEGNLGTIAEIKIVPAKMYRVDKLTAIIKSIRPEFTDYARKISSDDVAEQESARQELAHKYEKAALDFRHELDKLKSADKTFKADYKWPKLPRNMDGSVVKDLQNKLLLLGQQINTDGILSECAEWQKAYVKTYLRQEERANTPTKYSAKEAPRSDHLPPEMINRIAASIHLDVAALRETVKQELRTERVRIQVSERGKH